MALPSSMPSIIGGRNITQLDPFLVTVLSPKNTRLLPALRPIGQVTSQLDAVMLAHAKPLSHPERFINALESPTTFRNRRVSITTPPPEVLQRSCVSTFDELNALVVDEKHSEVRTNQQKLLHHLDFTLSLPSSPGLFDPQSNEPISLQPLPTISFAQRRLLRTARHFIGSSELMLLHQMTTFTELHIAKLNAIFAIAEVEGMLSQSAFWKLLSVAYTADFQASSLHSTHSYKGSSGSGDSAVPAVSPPCTTHGLGPSDSTVTSGPSSPPIIHRAHSWISESRERVTAESAVTDSAADQAPSGAVRKTYLCSNSLIGTRIFSFFDISTKNALTFQEFVLAIAVLCQRTTFIDLATFSFEVFDLRGDQLISLDELHVCAASIDMKEARSRSNSVAAAAKASAIVSPCNASIAVSPPLPPSFAVAVHSVSIETNEPPIIDIISDAGQLPRSSPRMSPLPSALQLQSPRIRSSMFNRMNSLTGGDSIVATSIPSPSITTRTLSDAAFIVNTQKQLYTTALEAVDSNHDGHLTPAEYAKMVQSYPQILKMFEIRSFSGFCNALLRQFRDSAASFASPETSHIDMSGINSVSSTHSGVILCPRR